MSYQILPTVVGIFVVSSCVNKIILLKSPKGQTKECRSTNAMYAGMIGAELEVENCAKEIVSEGSYSIEFTDPIYSIEKGPSIIAKSGRKNIGSAYSSFGYSCINQFFNQPENVLAVDCQKPIDIDSSEDISLSTISKLYKRANPAALN